MQYIYVISALILAVAVQQGEAIKCFVCNSHKDANCALDIPPDNLLKDCQEDYSTRGKGIPSYCRKITQIIEFSVNSLPPDSRVIRTCGFQNQTSTNYCYQRAGFGGRQVVCSCDTDNCNGAGALQASTMGLVTLLAALFAGKWLLQR
ncbi:UPAR/Ly6 domain-containing protein crok [Drosophila tropicalis]|uniref:Uncharacterized protein n=1 Tax=Drosophila willistoni TaxID=7260 RepID=B4N155_DROWI|nr:uncharacterized protein LOC6644234 [Drosophila willistoni]EDW78036.1 uncharacterized protein Dwil_GK24231 [Drosophila willistoni]